MHHFFGTDEVNQNFQIFKLLFAAVFSKKLVTGRKMLNFFFSPFSFFQENPVLKTSGQHFGPNWQKHGRVEK